MREVQEALNKTPSMQDAKRRSPAQIFYRSPVAPNVRDFVLFRCPVYVLADAIQQGKHINKWIDQARVGIYLGRSINHAHNVAVVMNKYTGHCSPQFHIQFDKSFQTVSEMIGVKTQWLYRSGITETKKGGNTKNKRHREGTSTSNTNVAMDSEEILQTTGYPQRGALTANNTLRVAKAKTDSSQWIAPTNNKRLPKRA